MRKSYCAKKVSPNSYAMNKQQNFLLLFLLIFNKKRFFFLKFRITNFLTCILSKYKEIDSECGIFL